MNKFIKRLKNSIAFAENELEDMDSVSWGMQEGILISYNEAKEIVSAFEWNGTKNMPEFDGAYQCYITRANECGTISKYQDVVHCVVNNWVTKDLETVTHWKKLTPNP